MSRNCSTIDLDTFEATKSAVSDDPALGRGAFTTVTEWQDGARARTTARSFTVETDEPTPLGGTDKAVDPMELPLAAIGTCLTIGWVTHAARRGVEFRDLKIEVTGNYDLQGYLGVDDSVRPGFTYIDYVVNVDADASDDVLAQIHAATGKGSPMVDNVLAATPVAGRVVR